MLLCESQALDAGLSMAFTPTPALALPASHYRFLRPVTLFSTTVVWQLHRLSQVLRCWAYCFDFQSVGGVFVFLSKWETLLCMQAASKSVLLKQKTQLNLEPIQIPLGGLPVRVLLSHFGNQKAKLCLFPAVEVQGGFCLLSLWISWNLFPLLLPAAGTWVCMFPEFQQ